MAIASARAPFGKRDVVDSDKCVGAADSPRQGALSQVEEYHAEHEFLRRKQEQMEKKQKDADEMRRGQLDALSERIYQVEKDLRAAQQQQQEAIDKANAAFQTHSFEMQRDRQNLMDLITQINGKFDDVSQELAQYCIAVQATQESFAEVQQEVQQATWDAQGDRATLAQFGSDFAWLQEKVNEQRDSIKHVHNVVEEAAHDTAIHEEFHDQFMQAETRRTEEMEEMRKQLRALSGKFNETQSELMEMQPKLLEVLRRVEQSHGHEGAKHAAGHRMRTELISPERPPWHDGVAADTVDIDRGDHTQSARARRASHQYADFDVPPEMIEQQHLDHGDSLSWALHNFPHASAEPSASDVPITSIFSASEPPPDVKGVTPKCRWWSAQQANSAKHEQQHIAHDVHQSSVLGPPSSYDYGRFGVPYYPGLDSWDSSYGPDRDGMRPHARDVRPDIHRLQEQGDVDWLRMSAANEEILHLWRGS